MTEGGNIQEGDLPGEKKGPETSNSGKAAAEGYLAGKLPSPKDDYDGYGYGSSSLQNDAIRKKSNDIVPPQCELQSDK